MEPTISQEDRMRLRRVVDAMMAWTRIDVVTAHRAAMDLCDILGYRGFTLAAAQESAERVRRILSMEHPMGRPEPLFPNQENRLWEAVERMKAGLDADNLAEVNSGASMVNNAVGFDGYCLLMNLEEVEKWGYALKMRGPQRSVDVGERADEALSPLCPPFTPEMESAFRAALKALDREAGDAEDNAHRAGMSGDFESHQKWAQRRQELNEHKWRLHRLAGELNEHQSERMAREAD